MDFIRREQTKIGRYIDDAKRSPSRNVRQAGDALEGILNGSDVPFGERSNCYVIADTLIVLESHAESAVYSSDSDVKAICEILGKSAYVETT